MNKSIKSIKIFQDGSKVLPERITLKCDLQLETDGKGYWSNRKTTVKVHKIEVTCTEYPDYNYVNVDVYFTKKTWEVRKHGLIYTDSKFERQLKSALKEFGINTKQFGYTEQGMQDYEYVSMSADEKFVKSLLTLYFDRKLVKTF